MTLHRWAAMAWHLYVCWASIFNSLHLYDQRFPTQASPVLLSCFFFKRPLFPFYFILFLQWKRRLNLEHEHVGLVPTMEWLNKPWASLSWPHWPGTVAPLACLPLAEIVGLCHQICLAHLFLYLPFPFEERKRGGGGREREHQPSENNTALARIKFLKLF